MQEHWLAENQFYLFNKHLDNINFHSITPMESGEIINGRQFGGCAIIWKNSLIASIKPISNQSKRVCAVTVKLGASSFLLCNVYMPTYQSVQISYIQEISDIFMILKHLSMNPVRTMSSLVGILIHHLINLVIILIHC